MTRSGRRAASGTESQPGESAPTRRGRPRAGVRERVLEATEAILIEAGITGLSTRDIARRAGVAESSIFYHFGDRLGLLISIVQLHVPLYKDTTDEIALTAGDGPLRDNLVALLDALEAFYLRIMPIVTAIQADEPLRSHFASRSQDLRIGPHRAIEPVVSYLDKERDIGRIRADTDLQATALLMISVGHYRAMERHTVGECHLPPTSSVIDTLMPALTGTPTTGPSAAGRSCP